MMTDWAYRFLAVCSNSFKTLPIGVLLLFWWGGSQVFGQNEDITTSGDVVLFALPATAMATTLVKGDKKGTWQLTKGLLLNQTVTVGLKYAINKNRPFNNGAQAFPSGHTSTTFQSASFLQRRYGWKFGVPAYALAGYTSYTRLQANKHDGWDVLGGIVVGMGSTYLFTTPYQKEHFELTFSGGPEGQSVGFTYKF